MIVSAAKDILIHVSGTALLNIYEQLKVYLDTSPTQLCRDAKQNFSTDENKICTKMCILRK